MGWFQAILNKIDQFNALSLYDVMQKLFNDDEFTDYIIYLNTQVQLYEQGIDATGKRLDSGRNGYAPSTILVKEAKGQPVDRVTLKDTGAFYDSFKCYFIPDGGDGAIQITADTIKEQTDLLVEWGKDIIGLDEDSLALLRDMARTKLLTIVQSLKAAA